MSDGKPEKGKTICVMIGDVSYDYTNELMAGMNEAARTEGARIIYMTGKQKHADPDDPEKENRSVSHYNSIYNYADIMGADAFIISCGSLSGFASAEDYRQFIKRFEGTAYVMINEELKAQEPRSTSITIDNYGSMCECAEHLLVHHGYRKIAFISGPREHPDARVRERAYRDTMQKHGIPVEEGMIHYGDLSGFVTRETRKLLSDYPGLEAIMLCNDEMARTVYKVCADSGLQVGRDIAVTGFDNFTTGRTMIPPLTTIAQNAFHTGIMAVKYAIALSEGKRIDPVSQKTSLRIRNSCGCVHGGDASFFTSGAGGDRDYLQDVTGRMREDLMSLFKQEGHEGQAVLIGQMMEYAASVALSALETPPDEQETAERLTEFARQMDSTAGLIAGRLNAYLLQAEQIPPRPAAANLYRTLLYFQGYLHAYELNEAAKRFESFRSKAWFVPEFIRDLVVLDDEDESVFRSAVQRLGSIGLEKVYVCLLPEPEVLRDAGLGADPGRLMLAAYLSKGAARAFPRSRMPVIDRTHPIRDLPDLDRDSQLITFSIFSGEVQYGIILCETSKEKNPLLHVIGLQLGILINFLDLKQKEKIVLSELERIRERIEILNFLSEYDEMTSIFNRRGFIERAIHMNRENAGKTAFCAFMDLDNLKQINDTFGHAKGDEALVAVSEILKKSVRSKDLIARLGGDEFIGLFILENPDFRRIFVERLKDAFAEYNRTSGHPFNVEISIGIAEFTCRQGMEISTFINEADRDLYKQKKNKRKSARKE